MTLNFKVVSINQVIQKDNLKRVITSFSKFRIDKESDVQEKDVKEWAMSDSTIDKYKERYKELWREKLDEVVKEWWTRFRNGKIHQRVIRNTPHEDQFGEGEDEVVNLYARYGKNSPNLCFAGHVDVVPEGSSEDWSFGPFSGEIINDQLCGRGAVDMKSSIATFISSAIEFLEENNKFESLGSISFIITSDEEGKAIKWD